MTNSQFIHTDGKDGRKKSFIFPASQYEPDVAMTVSQIKKTPNNKTCNISSRRKQSIEGGDQMVTIF